jgi:cellulose synthase/poly-beta-1,6-N-acetylglucosamine synthase-like glycosyltransferase
MGCVVIRVDFTPRSKAKAINHALSLIPDNIYDVCIVLDADNYLSPEALIKINSVYQSGAKAIQCQRVAKEITTPVSSLDAISEGINNTIFRKGHRVAGLSAALSGSGMAFDYAFFKEVMSRIEATNGFDKDLEFEIISEGVTIQYLEAVHVFDEKVSSLEVLKKQRTRWFAAQLINISKGFRFVIKKPSLDLFDKWVQMWLPSRLLLFGFMVLVSLVSLVLQYNGFTVAFALATVFTALALLLASPKKYLGKNFFSLLIHLPVSFFTLIVSFLSFNKARKGFIHTPHQSSSKA